MEDKINKILIIIIKLLILLVSILFIVAASIKIYHYKFQYVQVKGIVEVDNGKKYIDLDNSDLPLDIPIETLDTSLQKKYDFQRGSKVKCTIKVTRDWYREWYDLTNVTLINTEKRN